MSLSAQDVVDRLPYELASRLESDAYFWDIPVVVADEGNVEQTILKKQAAVTTKTGHRGAAVIVLQLIGQNEYAEVKFGPLRLHPSFQVIEQRELNRGPNGTGKSARQIARRIVDVIVSLRLSMLTWDFVADQPTIEPVQLAKLDGQNLIGYQVNFWTMEGDAELITQMTIPAFTDLGDSTLSLTAENNPGAEIYYTLDDSYPSKENPSAVLYESPITIPDDGFTIRACTYAPGTSNLSNDGSPPTQEDLNQVASPVARAIITKQIAPPVFIQYYAYSFDSEDTDETP